MYSRWHGAYMKKMRDEDETSRCRSEGTQEEESGKRMSVLSRKLAAGRFSGKPRPWAACWGWKAFLICVLFSLDVRGAGHERSLILSSTAIEKGEFQITLMDPDLNTDPHRRESVTVQMSADKKNEPVHDVVLTETDVDTGVFFGQGLVSSISDLKPSSGRASGPSMCASVYSKHVMPLKNNRALQ